MSEHFRESPPASAIREKDISEVPGVRVGTSITVHRINPATGEHDPEASDFSGVIIGGRYAQGKPGIHKDQPLRVLGEGKTTAHVTSPIRGIDAMRDGSYRLTTKGSVYEIRIAGQTDVGCFPGGTEGKQGGQDCADFLSACRRILKKLFGGL